MCLAFYTNLKNSNCQNEDLNPRQLKDTVEWLVSEQMLIYYIQLLKDSMWPDGELAEPLPQRTEEQKHFNRMLAKQKLLEGMPGQGTPFFVRIYFLILFVKFNYVYFSLNLITSNMHYTLQIFIFLFTYFL